MSDPLSIFLIATPGLAHPLGEEARAQGFKVTAIDPAGVTLEGGWPDIWRANLTLRGATRVLLRLASFRALHLAQLDKRASKLPWTDWLAPGTPVTVEATCRKSRIYHAKAATERIEKALTGAGMVPGKTGLQIKLRIEDDLATLSLDTSGDPLHKRGMKPQVNKAPLRETMAALLLRNAGFTGTETVLDPMCGSGTFVLEAAEIANALQPGRARGFAFEALPTFDSDQFNSLKTPLPDLKGIYFGSDRDAGAVAMSRANASRAGLAKCTIFAETPIADLQPPEAPPGLVITNPPYGGRIGKTGGLFGLYGTFGKVMKDQFQGWRVAMITSDAKLARATGLPWEKPGPYIDHGGTKIRLWHTQL